MGQHPAPIITVVGSALTWNQPYLGESTSMIHPSVTYSYGHWWVITGYNCYNWWFQWDYSIFIYFYGVSSVLITGIVGHNCRLWATALHCSPSQERSRAPPPALRRCRGTGSRPDVGDRCPSRSSPSRRRASARPPGPQRWEISRRFVGGKWWRLEKRLTGDQEMFVFLNIDVGFYLFLKQLRAGYGDLVMEVSLMMFSFGL